MRWIRHLRLSWILGLLLLGVSLLGASWYHHQPRNGEPQKGDSAAKSQKSTATNCTGVFAPEHEIIPLAPSVSGEVVEVFVKSEQQVKKGDKLLRLDDKLARSKLRDAEAGVKAAQVLLTDAETAQKTYELTVKAQQKLIKAKRLEREAAEAKLDKLRRTLDEKLADVRDEIKALEKSIEALNAGIEAAEIQLQIIELNKPESKVTQAEAGLEHAKEMRDQAKIGVDACLMTAPDDGVITRSFVGLGSKFGAQVQKPAFMFYSGKLVVRAEVDQESANRVKVGQTAVMEDYSHHNVKWTGKVTYVAKGFFPKRDTSTIPALVEQNQEQVRECQITLDPGQDLPLLNQKFRVRIGGD